MFITSMITDRIQRQEVLLPINHITIPFWKLPFFPLDKWLLLWLLWSILWLVDLAEWTLYDWLLQLSDYRCLITTNRQIILLDYNCTEWLLKNEAADAPITFEEIVMVMIMPIISISLSLLQKALHLNLI